MRYCRNCRRVTPGKDARYCAHCAGSFGGRRCPHDHLSPATARNCTQCPAQDAQLSRACDAIDLSWLPLLLSWGCVAGLLAVAWAERGALFRPLTPIAGAFPGFPGFHGFHVPWRRIVDRLLFWLLVLLLLLGKRGPSAFRAVGVAVFWAVKTGGALLSVAWQCVARTVACAFAFVAKRIVGHGQHGGQQRP